MNFITPEQQFNNFKEMMMKYEQEKSNDHFHNFKEMMMKYEQEKTKCLESEKSMKKSENGSNKTENKTNVSGRIY